MEPHDSYTRLLGLALRGGNLVTGSDATASAVSTGTARLLLLSADASVRTCKDAEQWAERGNCLLVALPCDKAELGGALGRGSVAVAALTDTGLAAAVGERLALYDADRYGAVAERLRLKSKRATERRTAHARARPDAKRKRKTPPSAASRRGGEKGGTTPRNEGTGNPPSVASRRHLPPKGGDKGETTPHKRASRPDDMARRKREKSPPERLRRQSPPPVGKGGAKRREEANVASRKRASRSDASSRKNPNAKK